MLRQLPDLADENRSLAPGGGAPRPGESLGGAPAPMAGWPVRRRRMLVLALNLATIAALALAVFAFLSAGGFDGLDGVIFAGFCLATPWTVLGFWNAVIGLLLLHGPADPGSSVYPYFPAAERPRRLSSRTAILMCLRNEAPEPVFRRLEAMRQSLEATGRGRHFRFFVLSDTDDPEIAAAEEAAFACFARRLAEAADAPVPVYRRRRENTGFKAGNIRDFLKAHGEGCDFFLPLDSDSVMSGEAIVRMVAAMEADPRIGILQSLVVGMPAESGFARIFQFGMRHGMRAFTMGSAWWSADCGPYWGHNAVIRTGAFAQHCRLPDLPGRPPLGGPVLSHDQLEAVFMRRAGFEVRVIPIETRSFEANPPTLPDFIKRDLRWCQGNMQYGRFLLSPGLTPVSRFQLLQAMLMYAAPAAWIVMTLATVAKAFQGGFDPAMLRLGLGLFLTIFALSIAPKLAGMLDVVLTPGALRAYGGTLRFGASAVLEVLASMLMAPIVALSVTLFLLGLPFGRRVVWSGQNRDRLGIGWPTALAAMAPQTLLGLALAAVLWPLGASALLWAAPFVGGLCLAAPFTVATAAPRLGRLLARAGLFAVPEESALPRVLGGIVPHAARRWRRPVRSIRSAAPIALGRPVTEGGADGRG
ncbi:glucans biosynthesis glucosyltransferase MdoH [Jiella sp. M17.18]|uniref:glucans biosynthesis glucosyltransferase MdoH n=1 Tax=Jiella sp. M17.18 TaxID=3234247 RepID=UPI0034DE956F